MKSYCFWCPPTCPTCEKNARCDCHHLLDRVRRQG